LKPEGGRLEDDSGNFAGTVGAVIILTNARKTQILAPEDGTAREAFD
jgi:hypothetical protein